MLLKTINQGQIKSSFPLQTEGEDEESHAKKPLLPSPVAVVGVAVC
jgi:hypothetical protein